MIEVTCIRAECDFGLAFDDRDRALRAFDEHRAMTGHPTLLARCGLP